MSALARRARLDWVGAAQFGYVLLFFVFILAPIAVVVVASFSDSEYLTFPITTYSLRWFARIYEYQPFLDAFIVTLKIAAISTFFGALLGVPAAIALARSNAPAATATMMFLLSPLSMPSIVLGFALLFYMAAIGLGISFTALAIAHTVVSIPYITRTVAGVYRGLSPGLEESALILGAGFWRCLWYIILPLIRPGVFAGCLFSILLSIDNLPISYFFSGPSTSTLPVVMLSYLENQFDPSIAAVSTIQLIFAVVALFVVGRIYRLDHMTPAM